MRPVDGVIDAKATSQPPLHSRRPRFRHPPAIVESAWANQMVVTRPQSDVPTERVYRSPTGISNTDLLSMPLEFLILRDTPCSVPREEGQAIRHSVEQAWRVGGNGTPDRTCVAYRGCERGGDSIARPGHPGIRNRQLPGIPWKNTAPPRIGMRKVVPLRTQALVVRPSRIPRASSHRESGGNHPLLTTSSRVAWAVLNMSSRIC